MTVDSGFIPIRPECMDAYMDPHLATSYTLFLDSLFQESKTIKRKDRGTGSLSINYGSLQQILPVKVDGRVGTIETTDTRFSND